MKISQIILLIYLLNILGCTPKTNNDEEKPSKEKEYFSKKEDSLALNHIHSGLFVPISSNRRPTFFSLCAYDCRETPFETDCPTYYELSEPHTSYNTSDSSYRYACGKLYPLTRNIKEKSNLLKDFIDSKGDKWETWYVSDTTKIYGFFYIQRFSWENGNKAYVYPTFRNKIRIVMSKEWKKKVDNEIDGFYKSISPYPFRRISYSDLGKNNEVQEIFKLR